MGCVGHAMLCLGCQLAGTCLQVLAGQSPRATSCMPFQSLVLSAFGKWFLAAGSDEDARLLICSSLKCTTT